jgi:sortase A
MPLYRYVKAKPKTIRISHKTRRKVSKTISASSMFLGIVMLGMVFYPIAEWQLTYQSKAPIQKLIKPTPLNLTDTKSTTGQVLANETKKSSDLTKASNWFPDAKTSPPDEINNITEFFISIPKLKIENAMVKVGGEDLNQSLINYKGTASPGNYGNSVIFGHSVLPPFFNPKDYHTIFSTLPTLKIGDEITAIVDKVEYRYTVYELRTVDPTDISVLEQKYDDSYLSLVTCTPPGMDWKRLIVRAKLTPLTNTLLQTL